MLRYNLTTLFILIAAFFVQQFIPALTGLSNARILIVHLVFLCCAVTVATPTMLILATLAGIFWDAQSYIPPINADPDIYKQPIESLRFGYSIILFGVIGFLMQGIIPLFRSGKWHFSALLTGIAIFLYLSIEFLLISFIRGNFIFTHSILRLLFYTSFLTMLLSPIVFWLLYLIAKIFNHSLYPQAASNLKRR